MTSRAYHVPVLLRESIDGLNLKEGGTYVDVTFGGGGHSLEILHRLSSVRLIGFDQDSDSAENKINDSRFTLVSGNFRYVKNYLRQMETIPVDGLLADLGISSHQIDEAQRGFSTRFDAPLDMRMNCSATKTAAEVVNTYSEENLTRLFRQYGELKNARSIASAIAKASVNRQIKTTQQLMDAVVHLARKRKENQFFARVFQALRIEVNEELKALEDLLVQSADVIKKGGRLVVISYHSLEDRLVKNFMKRGQLDGSEEKDFYGNSLKPFQTIFSKAIVPSEEEIAKNNRSRSAKLRIAERV